MILLNSSAFHIFWLGRYISRIQYLCNLFPFQQDELAHEYAQAFCLPAFDAASLNQLVLDEDQPSSFKQQFAYTKDNIHELRGVLTAYGYAELNKLIQTASENPGYICDVVSECFDILEAESHDVFLFFKLGQSVEQLNRELRFKHDIGVTLQELSIVVTLLEELGWENLIDNWEAISKQKNWESFYKFTNAISEMFGVDA